MNTNNGWKLVPVVPTEEMHVAAVRTIRNCTGNDDFPPRVLAAMLAAAPEAPPLTVTVDPDPRGVSVGVYQGSSCVYHGAHAVPAGAVADEGAKDELATSSLPPTYSLQPVATAFFTEKGEVAYTGIYDRTLKALESVKTTRMGISAGSIDLYHRPVSAPAAGDARAVAALAELVACDNIEKQIASMQVCVLETDDDVRELDALMSDLARRQPAAWDAARSALSASQQGGE